MYFIGEMYDNVYLREKKIVELVFVYLIFFSFKVKWIMWNMCLFLDIVKIIIFLINKFINENFSLYFLMKCMFSIIEILIYNKLVFIILNYLVC